MIKINDYFEISEGSEYELVSETYCGLKSPGILIARDGGRAEAHDGGTAVARDGGRAEAYNGGTAVAHDGGTAEAHDGGEICELFDLADDGKYKLTMTDDGYFYAGCAVNLTREQSLARWDRDDDRACLFTLAILSLDWGKPLFSKQ